MIPIKDQSSQLHPVLGADGVFGIISRLEESTRMHELLRAIRQLLSNVYCGVEYCHENGAVFIQYHADNYPLPPSLRYRS